MIRVTAVFLLILALTSAQFKEKTEEEFLKASEVCFKKFSVPQSFKPKFEKFDYPDEPIVHTYLHCIWTTLELWDDKNGFNVQHIADLYKDRANTEVLVPILSECNRNTQRDPPLEWLYRAFTCILNSRVGDWFKEDIAKVAPKS